MGKPFCLRDGYYKGIGGFYGLVFVEGCRATFAIGPYQGREINLKYGQFGEADKEIKTETAGQESYNVQLCHNLRVSLTEPGVVSEDGQRAVMKTGMGIATLEWITEEEATALKNDGDPLEAPPNHYKLQPDNPGKFLWITGPPGLGKSTTAHLLSKMAGFVYYEADCFFHCKNPYIPPSSGKEPSMAVVQQRKLVGDEAVLKKRYAAHRKGSDALMARLMGAEFDEDAVKEMFDTLCEDIEAERKRIGGDWAVASVVNSRSVRDHVRARLGPDLVFVVLDMEEEEMRERISRRHNGDEQFVDFLSKFFKLCEPAAEDEENAIAVKITRDMSREDVVEKIMGMIK